MKYSILSYNFCNYEILREPLEIDPNAEYIYVTDNPNLKSDKWKIIYLPESFNKSTGITKTMYVRYHPFDFVNTDTVIILDGSMQINKSLEKFYLDFKQSNCDCAIGCWTSPITNINSMYNYWLLSRNYNFDNYIKNKAMLLALNFTSTQVFHETGYMFFNKNEKSLQLIKYVWKVLEKISNNKNDIDRLDQTIFNAVLYKMFKDIKVMNLSRRLIQSKYITYCKHGTKNSLHTDINLKYENKYNFYAG